MSLRQVPRIVVRYEPWIVLALSPMLVFPREFSPLALGVMALLWPLRWLATGSLTRRLPADWAVLVLAIMAVVGTLVSADPGLSAPKLMGLLIGFALFYSIPFGVTGRREVWISAGLLCLLTLLVAGAGLVGTDWVADKAQLRGIYERLPRLVSSVPRSSGGGIHPNELGGALATLLPFVISCLLASARWKPAPLARWTARTGLATIVLIAGAAMVLAQSRSALGGLMAGLFLMGVLLDRRVAWALPVAAAAVGLQLWQGYVPLAVNSPPGVGASLSLPSRLEIWGHSLYAIADFPVTGIGLGTFQRVVPLLYPFRSIDPGVPLSHAHNIFLQVALDLGVIGFSAYLVLLVQVGLMLRRLAGRLARPERLLVSGLAAGLAALHVYGLTDAIAPGAKPGVAFWFMIGMVAALYNLLRDGRLAPESGPRGSAASNPCGPAFNHG